MGSFCAKPVNLNTDVIQKNYKDYIKSIKSYRPEILRPKNPLKYIKILTSCENYDKTAESVENNIVIFKMNISAIQTEIFDKFHYTDRSPQILDDIQQLKKALKLEENNLKKAKRFIAFMKKDKHKYEVFAAKKHITRLRNRFHHFLKEIPNAEEEIAKIENKINGEELSLLNTTIVDLRKESKRSTSKKISSMESMSREANNLQKQCGVIDLNERVEYETILKNVLEQLEPTMEKLMQYKETMTAWLKDLPKRAYLYRLELVLGDDNMTSVDDLLEKLAEIKYSAKLYYDLNDEPNIISQRILEIQIKILKLKDLRNKISQIREREYYYY